MNNLARAISEIRNKSKPDFDRLRRVILRQGRQDLPMYEIMVDPETIKVILGDAFDPGKPRSVLGLPINRLNYYPSMGYDHIPCKPALPLVDFIPRVGEDTAKQKRESGRVWEWVDEGPIQTSEDFERYPFPTIDEIDFSEFDYLCSRRPDGVMLTGQLQGIFGAVTKLMGVTALYTNVLTQPDLVQGLFDRLGELSVRIYRNMASIDEVGALVLSDDLGFNTQTFLSPDDLRRFVFPWHKKIVDAIHAAGKPCILHCCGNLAEIYEDLIEDVGIDARHSYQDVILPVTEAYKRYGDRIGILGGVDVDVLCRCDEESLCKYIRDILEQCAGSAYALGSGNTIANYIPVENYLVMLREGLRFRGDI